MFENIGIRKCDNIDWQFLLNASLKQIYVFSAFTISCISKIILFQTDARDISIHCYRQIKIVPFFGRYNLFYFGKYKRLPI